ncbi:MAG: hypothetical protein AAGC49_07400 [Brevundimonas sp.]
MLRGLRTAATIGISALVGSAVTGYVLTHQSEPVPEMPKLFTQTLTADADVDLPFTWTVPAAGGCAAHTFRAPVEQEPVLSGDGRVTAVPLRAEQVAFNTVCLPSVEEADANTDTPLELVRTMTNNPRTLVSRTVVSPYGTALRTERTMGKNVLTEWWTTHDGMTWISGYLHEPDDLSLLPTVESMLASWTWS